MKSYTITVNGNVYQVTVEEGTPASAPVSAPAAAAAAPVVPAAPPAPAAAPAASANAGGVEITSPVPGKIFKIEASVGQAMKKGDIVLILESMKMEIPVVAPEDGTIASIDVLVGAAIEPGDVLATLNE